MTVRLLFALSALLLATLSPRTAQAAITCEVIDNPDIPYGTIDLPVSTAITASTFVRVRCTGDRNRDRGDPVRICVGLNTPLLPRRMVHASGDFIQHGLYLDAARSQHIQYTTPNAEIVVTLPSSGNVPVFVTGDVPIYGKLVGSSVNPRAGAYSETVTGAMGSGPTTQQCAAITAAVPVNFNATGTVRANCTIATSNLSFGTVNLLATNIDSNTTVGLNCTNGAAYSVRLNGGTVTGNVAARRMGLSGSGPGVINYELRHTSAGGPLWGDGTAGTTTLTGTGNGASQTITLFGRVPGGQPAPAVGTYSDTVTATVEF